jgi:hypothetical protein
LQDLRPSIQWEVLVVDIIREEASRGPLAAEVDINIKASIISIMANLIGVAECSSRHCLASSMGPAKPVLMVPLALTHTGKKT